MLPENSFFLSWFTYLPLNISFSALFLLPIYLLIQKGVRAYRIDHAIQLRFWRLFTALVEVVSTDDID